MPQTGPDLVGAGYPISRPLLSLLGGTSNLTVTNVGARTNLDYPLGNIVDGTAPSTGVSLSVPVPVVPGDVITKMTWICGATSASVITEQVGMLYAGTGSVPALIGQGNPSPISTAITSSGIYSITLATPQTITVSNAPYGFVYASINVTASTVPTFASMTSTTATYVLGGWYSTGPRFLAATHDSGVGSTAPATMGTQTAVAKAPICILT